MKKLVPVVSLVALVAACGAPSREVPSLTAPLPSVAATPAPARPPAPPEPPADAPIAAYDGPMGGAVGDHAPLLGNELATARGKVAIVHVFASWCMPCAKVLPALQAMHAKQKGNLAIVAISVDDEEAPSRKFAASFGVTFPVAWDDDKKIVDKWKPASMPTTYIVDRAGIVRHVHSGYQDGEAEVFRREVEALY